MPRKKEKKTVLKRIVQRLIGGGSQYNSHKMTRLLTLAAPVLLGMMLNEAALPPLQSLLDGPSTVFCVAELQNINKQTK